MTAPIATKDIPQEMMVSVRGCATRWRLFGLVCVAYQREVAKTGDVRNWEAYDGALSRYREHIEGCDQCRKRSAAMLEGSTVVPHPDEPKISDERAAQIAQIRKNRGV